ncbi:chloramphenicol phosphotransferase CPT family protein [Epibacterium sp. Ofav1-8]|uniref:chloramphenicol phosphotransferase CPT family protein n=1 Tax=Epibacterium sp. Ofav1-8 TaxID=2917735 RepID=UPI001EF4B8BF|nr:AAA family ATPase [Epibacterium sp. Ofav1-8]MCG7623672.1 chloramphenicol phosphotransferase CPT family protein [Epibacterium sp. Ofav1-8]
MALILFLHGPSSSGKSTLATAIRNASERPFLHLSIDHLRDSGAWTPAAYPDWSAARPQFFSGFHRAIAGFADAGNDLIVEHILDTPGWHQDLQQRLAGHEVIFVGLMTPLAVLEAREAARADRPAGSAARDFGHVHDGLVYDVTFDGRTGAQEGAQQILARIAAPRARSHFFD